MKEMKATQYSREVLSDQKLPLQSWSQHLQLSTDSKHRHTNTPTAVLFQLF